MSRAKWDEAVERRLDGSSKLGQNWPEPTKWLHLMGGKIRTRFLEVHATSDAFHSGASDPAWIWFKSSEADGRVCVVIPVLQLRSARQPVELHWQPGVIKHCRLIHTMQPVHLPTKHWNSHGRQKVLCAKQQQKLFVWRGSWQQLVDISVLTALQLQLHFEAIQLELRN